jgi:hypothetical protein
VSNSFIEDSIEAILLFFDVKEGYGVLREVLAGWLLVQWAHRAEILAAASVISLTPVLWRQQNRIFKMITISAILVICYLTIDNLVSDYYNSPAGPPIPAPSRHATAPKRDVPSQRRTIAQPPRPGTPAAPAAIPNFAGNWIEINPANGNQLRLQITQNGTGLNVDGNIMTVVNGVAAQTHPQSCAPRFRTPGYDYNGPNLAGPNTLKLSISGAILIYEVIVDWLVPCGGHSPGTEYSVSRLQRS